MRFLQEFASKNGCSLYNALERTVEDDLFKNTKAKKLLALVERFSAFHQEMPISELFSKLLDESGYEVMLRTEGGQERLDNLAELKQSVYEYETMCGEETTLTSYLAHVALMTNSDSESGRNAVKMMTVHTAKGLEFPYVFLCGMSEGVFPSKKTSTQEGMEEERRLAFVAFTRAEKGLYLTDAEGRNLDGSFRYPSRFIFNVDRSLLQYTSELDPRLISDAKLSAETNEKMLELRTIGPSFGPGDRIVHSIMGAGEILDLDRDSSAYVVKFDSLPTARKISMKAKLERE
jgi:DNA helicase-2/ATP-dependent DNA helicase PcrA